jgi:hypothetical protein
VIQVDGNALVMPGDQAEIAFERGKTVGAGLVTAVEG